MKHCLVVDDSSVIRKVARRILEKFEFRITEAEDGQQALDQCKQAMPDAVLLDWNMPVMDGYEFLKELRALRAGANEYIMKPFDQEIVEAKFQEVGLI